MLVYHYYSTLNSVNDINKKKIANFQQQEMMIKNIIVLLLSGVEKSKLGRKTKTMNKSLVSE